MKGGTLQIAWHGSDPVLTLDFHCTSGLLATGGADHDIKLWTVYHEEAKPQPLVTFEANLSYHTSAVNVVRFSPTGDQLASGADGGELLIWKCLESSEIASMWKVLKTMRFHHKDVLDLEWSTDGASLISGSVDNSVIIWDVVKGNPQQVLKDHMHYVQGVAWDPAGQFVASISGDRTCRIYSNRAPSSKAKGSEKTGFLPFHVIVKADTQKQDSDSSSAKAGAKPHLFHDETLPSFFRRLSWSPDGSFLLVPSGIHKLSSESTPSNTTYIISRRDLSRPALHLPVASKPVVAVRFCPILFTLRLLEGQKHENDASGVSAFKLPYRIVFAVATLNSLFIYDTQSACPLAILAGLHYASITDIAWSWDAKFLGVSSQDGFCTLVAFEDGELGSPLSLNDAPSHVASYLPRTRFMESTAAERKHGGKAGGSDGKDPGHGAEGDTATAIARPADCEMSWPESERAVSLAPASVSAACCIAVPLKCETNEQEFEQTVPSACLSLDSKHGSLSDAARKASAHSPKPRRITPIAIPAERACLLEGLSETAGATIAK